MTQTAAEKTAAVAAYYRAIEDADAEVSRQVRDGERFPITWQANIDDLRERAAHHAAEGDVDGLRDLWKQVAGDLAHSPCPNVLATVLDDIREAADIAKDQPWHNRVLPPPPPPVGKANIIEWRAKKRRGGPEVVDTARKGLTAERAVNDPSLIFWKG
jgi:hypothetical protein